MSTIVHSWKSFTAQECNKVLGRTGRFWQREPFDRYIRNERHFRNALTYIENNPVKAGLQRADRLAMEQCAVSLVRVEKKARQRRAYLRRKSLN
jgi:REP element-mobilizing transposase RayT